MSGPVDWTKGDRGGYGNQPSYPQPQPQQGYGQAPGGYGSPQVPPTHAGWAVAATLFFWPLAFTAWSASSDVVRLWVMGDRAGAQAASDRARKMGKIALWIGIGSFVFFIVVYVVLIAAVISASSSNGFS